MIPIDYSAGHLQDYVEDCPVCCVPHHIVLEIDVAGVPTVTAHRE